MSEQRVRMFKRGAPAELCGEQPECFAPRQWRAWQAAELGGFYDPDPNGFCAECLPEFKHQMEREGRCRHPGVRFAITIDGPAGIRPLAEKATTSMVSPDVAEAVFDTVEELVADVVFTFGRPA